jgi:site-specific DNA-methyltransferase (adenine-specific)
VILCTPYATAEPRRLTLDTVTCCDALTFLRGLPDASVALIAVDPPYNGVKDEGWDNQWKTDADYLTWLGEHLREFRRILKANGSLYVFASPRMAARVEIAVGEQFNVLNQVVWLKPSSRHNQADADVIRGYFPQTERLIFAEHGCGDVIADEIAGFSQAEIQLKKRIFGDYIKSELGRAGVSNHEIVGAIGAYREHNHGGAATNWLLGYNCPTPEQYSRMRDYLNGKGGEFLRTEYEELRAKYEGLRRPFNVTAADPYTDVWTFPTVNTYPGKHPCEKPLDLMRHIVRASSRPGDVVLDCFSGSGATLDAARREGRHYIGCDADPHWVKYAQRRVTTPFALPLFVEIKTIDTPAPLPIQEALL